MTEDSFRIAVTAGVALAALAFVVQAIVVIILSGSFRKLQRKLEALSDRAGPVIQKIEPLIEKAGPAVEKAGPMLEKAAATLERAGPLLDKSAPLMVSLNKATLEGENLLATVNLIVAENRPKVTEVTNEVANIAKSGREQV